jgi:Flp pilus assembly protein TadD
MRLRLAWVALGAVGLLWLAGCQTVSVPDPLGLAKSDELGKAEKPAPVTPELLGADANDDLSIAKKYFRQGSYGLAERHFRRAVELHQRDGESWLGLAASYDRLKRFDLADRAYAQAIKIVGATPEILNNQGFSYMLRGDYRRARVTFLEAQSRAPDNPYIKNNLRMLAESERKGKAIN